MEKSPVATTIVPRPPYDLVPIAPVIDSREGDGLEVFQLLTILRQNKRFILLTAFAAFCLVLAATLVSSMKFESTARVYLGELEKTATSNRTSDVELSDGAHGDTATELEILNSRTLITRAILESGLDVDIRPPGWSPPRYWRWLASWRAPSLLEGATQEIGAINSSFKDRSIPVKPYEVRFTSDVDYEIRPRSPAWSFRRTTPNDEVSHGRLGEALSWKGLSLTLVKGTDRGPAKGARYDVDVFSMADVYANAKKALEVSIPTTKVPIPGEAVKVADLTFSSKSPDSAARFLESLMRGYLEERHSWDTENATAAEAFVTTQLGTIRASLDDVQKKLADYRATHSVVVLDEEAKALVEEIGKFEQERFDTRIGIESMTALDNALKKPNAPVEAFMFAEANDPVLTGLATSLSTSQQKLAEADSRFNPAAPDVREQQAQVDSQRAAIRSYVTNRLNRGRESLSKLTGIIGQYEERLKSVPGAELGLAQLTRESEVYSNVYSFLLKRQQETAIAKASTISKNRVLDTPEVPYREKWPQPWLPLVGMVLGLALGSILVLARGPLSGRLQSTVDVKRYLGRVPVVATIPHVRIPKRFARGPQSASEAQRASAIYLEAFRTLRTTLYAARARGIGNVILFTSPCKGDGKTTCAYSLASTLARAGTSVLLVDTDLHDGARERSVVHAREGKDLRAVLQGCEVWSEVVEPLTVPPGCSFHVIHGGGPDSAELLLTAEMGNFIAQARKVYDFVLLDSTSFPGLSDALVLTSYADCVLSVVRLEHTQRRLAMENVQRVASMAPTYGVIVNDARV